MASQTQRGDGRMKITIDEAIRLLQGDIDDPGSVAIEDVNKAEELGIEALKVRQAFIEKYGYENYILLPGETKE